MGTLLAFLVWLAVLAAAVWLAGEMIQLIQRLRGAE